MTATMWWLPRAFRARNFLERRVTPEMEDAMQSRRSFISNGRSSFIPVEAWTVPLPLFTPSSHPAM